MKNNTKKILCYNIITWGKCNYGNKCMYAHSLDEQNIIPIRSKIYDMLKDNKSKLDDLDLIEDNDMYENLCQLTKVCTSCEKHNCSGGYNCRNGSISKDYKICYDNLVYGNCKYSKCNFIHLTDRGLIPYLKQKNKNKIPPTKPLMRDPPKAYKILKNENTNNTNKFLLQQLLFTEASNNTTDSMDTNDDENTDDIITFLNNNNDSDDESIFLV